MTEPVVCEPAPPRPPEVRFGDGVACLAFYLLGQLVSWTAFTFVAFGRVGARASRDAVSAEMLRLAPIALPVTMAAGALALVLTLRHVARRVSWPVLRAELDLGWGSLRTNVAALGGALILAAGSTIAAYIASRHGTVDTGFLGRVVATSTAGRLAFVVAAVCMAGPTEEVLFRGALLTAFGKISRIWIAAVAAGLAFWLLHEPVVGRSWSAGLFIALFAAFATVLRLRSRSLGPAVTAHVAYNLALSLLVLHAG